jgi:hypothetical protein
MGEPPLSITTQEEGHALGTYIGTRKRISEHTPPNEKEKKHPPGSNTAPLLPLHPNIKLHFPGVLVPLDAAPIPLAHNVFLLSRRSRGLFYKDWFLQQSGVWL